MANLAELFKSCKYLSPLNVVCVLKIITFRFTLNYNISFYNSLTFRFGGLIIIKNTFCCHCANILFY
nr:MAG TPA: hypothetical protein [Caudoviricetes sp.]